jgi:hypothetical protein
MPGLLRVAKGVLCAALHLAANSYVPVSHLESSWFPDLNMLQKCGQSLPVTSLNYLLAALVRPIDDVSS